MTKIIALCNQKGGVGKTSTAISLSAGLSIEGKKCLLVDLDPQANATSGIGIDKNSVDKSVYHCLIDQLPIGEVMRPTMIDGLFVLPSSQDLAGAEVELVSQLGREWKLKRSLAQLDGSFDYVIVDCPPSLGLLTINALACSHSILIPLQCEYYALEGLSQLSKTIGVIKENLNASLEIEGILMTMADYRTNLTQEVINEVKKHFGDKVYKTVIPRNIRLSECPGFGKPIYLYDKDSEGAKKYKEFTKEFISRFVSPLISVDYNSDSKNVGNQENNSESPVIENRIEGSLENKEGV